MTQRERGFMAKSAPMSKTPARLTAQSPLGGYEMSIKGASLIEITGLSMVSVAPLAGSQPAFQKAIAKLFKTAKNDSQKISFNDLKNFHLALYETMERHSVKKDYQKNESFF